MNTEWFDLVDERDQIIGQASRNDCHHNPNLIHRAVYIIIQNQLGEIFWQLRSLQKDVSPGLWTFSATGHVDAGETYEAAARRELSEELSVQTDIRMLGKFLLRFKHESEYTCVFRGQHEGPFHLQAAEISDGRFLTLAQVESDPAPILLAPQPREIIKLVKPYL